MEDTGSQIVGNSSLDELVEIENAVDSLRLRIKILEKENDELKIFAKSYEEVVPDLEAKIKHLENVGYENEGAEFEVLKLCKSNDDLESENEIIRNKCDSLELSNEHLKTFNETLQVRLNEIQENNTNAVPSVFRSALDSLKIKLGLEKSLNKP